MNRRFLSALVIPASLGCSAAQAAITVNSHTFAAVTSGAISTAGTADWGFVSTAGGFFDSDLDGSGASHLNTDFGNFDNNGGTILTTVDPSPTIGAVTLSEGTAGTDTISPQGNTPNYTFDGNQAFGSYGNFGPTEQDIWQLTFNDLGVGEFDITLYMGHSDNSRVFDMDVTATGIPAFTTTSPGTLGSLGSTVAAYGTSGSAFIYNINVTTSDALDDLSLTFGSTGGTFGGAIFSGYTVTAIPEPTTPALFGLAALIGFIRRHR